jgi:hypothetical protein
VKKNGAHTNELQEYRQRQLRKYGEKLEKGRKIMGTPTRGPLVRVAKDQQHYLGSSLTHHMTLWFSHQEVNHLQALAAAIGNDCSPAQVLRYLLHSTSLEDAVNFRVERQLAVEKEKSRSLDS